jgi:UPF0271 protein
VNHRAVLVALRALPNVIDAVVSERHALVSFDPRTPPAGVVEAIEDAATAPSPSNGEREGAIPVRYDGTDLQEIAATTGLRVDDVVDLHVGATYTVAAIGFLPGFAYLRGLHPKLVVPRRATPRARVAPFSVAIAGPYSGVYPFASPGGWNVIGTAVGFKPFDASSGAALSLGDRVRFRKVPA